MCKVFGDFTGWPSQYMYGGHDEQGLENQSELAVYHCFGPTSLRLEGLVVYYCHLKLLWLSHFDQFLML
jgi:hypothetical protein